MERVFGSLVMGEENPDPDVEKEAGYRATFLLFNVGQPLRRPAQELLNDVRSFGNGPKGSHRNLGWIDSTRVDWLSSGKPCAGSGLISNLLAARRRGSLSRTRVEFWYEVSGVSNPGLLQPTSFLSRPSVWSRPEDS